MIFTRLGDGNYYCFFPSTWKVANSEEQFIICVKESRMLFGRNLRAVLVMRSSPGAFFLRRLLMIFWIVPGVVNKLDLVIFMSRHPAAVHPYL